MDLPDGKIKPKEFSDYLSSQLNSVYKTGESVTITTILDYGYFDELGLRADTDDIEDLNSIDYRNLRVQVVTISLNTSKSKGKHFGIDRKIYYIDISEDGVYTILSMKQAKIYSTRGMEDHIDGAKNILKKIFIPFYPKYESYSGYPINSVVSDILSLKSMYQARGLYDITTINKLIRSLIQTIVSHSISTYIVFGDDGEESKWENETDELNRIKILYVLFSGKPYDDNLGTSRAAIINAISNLEI